MPTRNDEELAKVYDRINTLESKVDSTNGYLKGVVESNEKLIRLFAKSASNPRRPWTTSTRRSTQSTRTAK